jgi:hypothetical protein
MWMVNTNCRLVVNIPWGRQICFGVHARACAATTSRALPPDWTHICINPSCAGIDCFEGFLVNCLEDCNQGVARLFGTSQANGGAMPVRPLQVAAAQENHAVPPQRMSLQSAPAATRPALVPKLKRKYDGGFSAPRSVAVPALTERTGVLQYGLDPCKRQAQLLQQRAQHPAPPLQQPQHQQQRQYSCRCDQAPAPALRCAERTVCAQQVLHACNCKMSCLHGTLLHAQDRHV